MRFSSTILFALLLSFVSGYALGQKAFKEGTLIYDVTIDPPGNQEGVVQYTGTYIITVKDKQVRKELKMNNGFSIVMLFDEKHQKAYTLKEMQGKKYAIQLDTATIAEKRARYEHYSMKEKGAATDIAWMAAKKGLITYKDGSTKEIYYSGEWVPEVLLFEQLPGIQVLPLAFQSRGDDGMLMHFRAQKVIAEPVETSTFKIPEDYKVMSSLEYRQLTK